MEMEHGGVCHSDGNDYQTITFRDYFTICTRVDTIVSLNVFQPLQHNLVINMVHNCVLAQFSTL